MSNEPQDDAPDATYPSSGTEYVIFDPEDDIAAPRVWDVGEYCDGDAIIGPELVTFDRRTILNLWTDFPREVHRRADRRPAGGTPLLVRVLRESTHRLGE